MRTPDHVGSAHDVDSTMTPMIDVVFLLLIFFVCTASFQVSEEILPSYLQAAGGVETDIEVEPDPTRKLIKIETFIVDTEVHWTIDKRPWNSLAEVRAVLEQLAEIDASLPVVLDFEGDVPLGDAMNVFDLCRLAGFDKIHFAAEAGSG